MSRKLCSIFYDFGKQLQRDNISAYASSTAFFFFLSIAPMLLVVCSIVTYTPITEEMILELAVKFLPDSMHIFAVAFINQMYNMATAVLPVAVVAAIWSAGKGMVALQMGLNVVHGVVETRNFVIIRLQASFYTLVTLLAIISTFALSLFSKNMASFIGNIFPDSLKLMHFFSNYRFIFGGIILTILFTLIYTFIPNTKLKLAYQLPGAALIAIGWQIYSWAFSLYIKYFGGFGSYGSLSTIVVIMFWLYFSMYLLLIGANLNRYFKPIIKVFYRRKQEKTKQK